MRCLFCDKEINTYSLYDLFIEQDKICSKCRTNLKYHHQRFKIDDLDVESFYDYDSLFKDLLLQYKECYDEALAEIFLYKIIDYLKIKYFGYQILYVPSSSLKRKERGFDHLKEIFKFLGFEEVEGLKMKNDLCQAGKDLSQRLMMCDNYEYDGKPLNKVLIVDDVCTTGSSLRGVYHTIEGKCRKCKAVVLAKT